jgi:hypothetical protein
MVNTVDWVEIRTGDIEKTAEFYGKLFGWTIAEKIDAEGTPYWIFDTGDTPREENLRRGAFWLRAHERPSTVVYILVDDIDTMIQKAKELGGRVIAEKTQVDPQRYKAYITDPYGTMIGLWEEK